MPCMGPGVNEIEVKEAYEEVLTLLRSKYKLQPAVSTLKAMGRNDTILMCRRQYLNLALKRAIIDLFMAQACEDF
jgi:hypothetical protein